MADEIDRAAQRQEEMLADALQGQARRAGLAGKTLADSALNCRACDAPIPAIRRSAVPGCQMCVECQERQERQERHKKGVRR